MIKWQCRNDELYCGCGAIFQTYEEEIPYECPICLVQYCEDGCCGREVIRVDDNMEVTAKFTTKPGTPERIKEMAELGLLKRFLIPQKVIDSIVEDICKNIDQSIFDDIKK